MLDNVHKPTLAWSTGIATVLIVVAIILLIVWISRKEKVSESS